MLVQGKYRGRHEVALHRRRDDYVNVKCGRDGNPTETRCTRKDKKAAKGEKYNVKENSLC